jgi:hypothetical protein
MTENDDFASAFPVDDRWQDLMKSMDPVANLNALADVWRQAATSSEQVISTFVSGGGAGSAPSGAGPSGRDLRLDIDRSVDQMADAAKRFFEQMPWTNPTAAGSRQQTGATVTVLDGIGTTELTLPSGSTSEKAPFATGVVRHDGAIMPQDAVTIRPSPSFVNDTEEGANRFIVKVSVPSETSPGTYHGQILCPGLPDTVVSLRVNVYLSE